MAAQPGIDADAAAAVSIDFIHSRVVWETVLAV